MLSSPDIVGRVRHYDWCSPFKELSSCQTLLPTLLQTPSLQECLDFFPSSLTPFSKSPRPATLPPSTITYWPCAFSSPHEPVSPDYDSDVSPACNVTYVCWLGRLWQTSGVIPLPRQPDHYDLLPCLSPPGGGQPPRQLLLVLEAAPGWL